MKKFKKKKSSSPMYRLTGVSMGLWARAKAEAAGRGETISDVIIRALDQWFRQQDVADASGKVQQQ